MKLKSQLTTAGVLSVSLLSTNCASNGETTTQRLNVVLINIDDLGWTDLSFMGSDYYETPNIDRLRSEGVYFSNAYAAAANSAPSRSSMLTGVYSSRHGVYTVDPADRGKAKDRKLISAANRLTPDPKYKLLTETMQESGYRTCMVGKWHVGEDPTKQGVDVNVAGCLKGHPKSYTSPYKNPAITDGEDGEFLTDRLAAEAVKFMETCKGGDAPFFLYFATYAVHTPLQPKPELAAKYAEKEGTAEHHNNKYAALVETMDTNVGVVLDYLRSSGLDKNTVIVLTSDNGGVYDISKQHPLRAGKGSFYEGGIRVPMIVVWDGHTAANTTCDTPVSQMDLYPTLLDIVGVSDEGLNLDGEVITSQIEGKAAATERALYWHFPAYLQGGNEETTDPIFRSRPVSVIRKGDWKLIYNYESETAELYNLSNDLSERNDLATTDCAKATQMQQELFTWLRSVDAPTEFELNPKYQK
ncbi:MAG: sulfatase [Rikenellaceae bacterium]